MVNKDKDRIDILQAASVSFPFCLGCEECYATCCAMLSRAELRQTQAEQRGLLDELSVRRFSSNRVRTCRERDDDIKQSA